jgi:non-homologous end joining protein Ku/predicted HicB family RNase H-like nuclease
MSTVHHGDYQGEVLFEDGKLVLRILHINDLITTEVESAAEVQSRFAELVEDYLASCVELRRAPDKPFKGLFNVRIPPALHKEVAFAAANEKVTLNAYVAATLQEKVSGRVSANSGAADEYLRPRSVRGFLRFSLVTCPVILLPASLGASAFDQISDGVTFEIEEFISKDEIDPPFLSAAYYIVPAGSVGHDAYAVIRETMKATEKVGLAWAREGTTSYPLIVEARHNGIIATALRTADQVINADNVFQSVQPVKISKDMIDLAKHIVEAKKASFDPKKLKQSTTTRLKSSTAPVLPASRSSGNVINLMDALRRSQKEAKSSHRTTTPRRKA